MKNEFSDELIEIVKTVMSRKGISKVELAKRLNISKATLSNYLLKYRGLPYDTAILIAKELDIDISRVHNLSSYPLDTKEYKTFKAFEELFDKSIQNKNNH